MKVGELIGLLSKYDPDREIKVYGSLDADDMYGSEARIDEREQNLRLTGEK